MRQVDGIDRCIADLGEAAAMERREIRNRVIRPHRVDRHFPDLSGTQTRAIAIADATIEGNTANRHVEPGCILCDRQPEETYMAGKAGHDQRIGWLQHEGVHSRWSAKRHHRDAGRL